MLNDDPPNSTQAPRAGSQPLAPPLAWSAAELTEQYARRSQVLSVPLGLHASGLPIGLQIVGRHFEDALVLRAGHAFERARGPFPRAPSFKP